MAAFSAAFSNFPAYSTPCHLLATANDPHNIQTSLSSNLPQSTSMMPLPTPPSDHSVFKTSIKTEASLTSNNSNNNDEFKDQQQNSTVSNSTVSNPGNCENFLL